MKLGGFLKSMGVLLIVAGLIIAGTVAYRNSSRAGRHLVFSNKTMLAALYDDYKKHYWEAASGRTIDRERDDITTSEGQSYTMLRAVWMSDQSTFDKTWHWTTQQLQHQSDHLFAWKWGKQTDGSYGVLSAEGGDNTAADADTDIALALMMAAGRWQDQRYLDAARQIVPDIWEQEVITIQDQPYLASNNLEKRSDQDAIINVSYFAPYAYREFAKLDRSHDWNALINSSYSLINRSLSLPLDKLKSAGLPPDWLAINQTTGDIHVAGDKQLTTNYSFDAMRTPWRLALDYEWHNEAKARESLRQMSVLDSLWQQSGALYSTYGHDGPALKHDEVPAVYGGDLGYFAVMNRSVGQTMYDNKLKSLYDQDNNAWAGGVSYYSDNWAWFGMALFDHQLDNPAEHLQYKDN